jgi:hypothetical protein
MVMQRKMMNYTGFSEHHYFFIIAVYTQMQHKPYLPDQEIQRLQIPKTTCNTSFLLPSIKEKAAVQPQFYNGLHLKVLLHSWLRILTTHFS